MTGFYRLLPDAEHAYLIAAGANDVLDALMLGGVHGLPLAAEWQGSCKFVEDEEEPHPKGLGDCAGLLTHLFALVSAKAREVVVPLLEGNAEFLPAKLDDRRILVGNVHGAKAARPAAGRSRTVKC